MDHFPTIFFLIQTSTVQPLMLNCTLSTDLNHEKFKFRSKQSYQFQRPVMLKNSGQFKGLYILMRCYQFSTKTFPTIQTNFQVEQDLETMSSSSSTKSRCTIIISLVASCKFNNKIELGGNVISCK